MENRFKVLLLISFFYNSFLRAEITDSSFSNKDRFVFLPAKSVGDTNSLNLEINFYPPEGKKVNKASLVKVWEKEKNKWVQTELLELDMLPINFINNVLTYDFKLKSKKSEIGIEVDFIHCSHEGGQCAEERYLGKISREAGIKKGPIKYSLRIKT